MSNATDKLELELAATIDGGIDVIPVEGHNHIHASELQKRKLVNSIDSIVSTCPCGCGGSINYSLVSTTKISLPPYICTNGWLAGWRSRGQWCWTLHPANSLNTYIGD